jgi:hypothetical protein
MPAMTPRFAGILLLAVVGCDDDGPPIAVDASPLDAFEVAWWTPEPGEASNWDIQLTGVDVSAERAMYVLDLWELVPAATTLEYGDDDPVEVPAGSLAGTLAQLHARTPRPIVICHVNTGAIELDDPDARKFPGFEPDPPDDPTPPEPGSVIGWSTPQGPEERFLDIREPSRASWVEIMWKRIDLAKQIGCDGIAPDHNDQHLLEPGFEVGVLEQLSWFEEVARQAHQRELSVGMVNGHVLANQPDSLVDDYDWALPERCAEFDDCGSLRPFINARKAVFALDYEPDADGFGIEPAIACARYDRSMISDGLVKDLALTAEVRSDCRGRRATRLPARPARRR